MLHNDNYNRREYVVKVLLKTVDGLTVDDAVVVMQVTMTGCWPGYSWSTCRRFGRIGLL